MYQVKEIFLTLQGEGANAGRAAVFCRFAGCNLWSGREEDRSEAVCAFCDTDFVGADPEKGGGRFSRAENLVAAIAATWAAGERDCFAVLTGGEPMLQIDTALIRALHGARFEIAIETNGTIPVPAAINWICVSPKAGADLVQRSGDELKLVYPQTGLHPDTLTGLDFRYRYLQPMDGPCLSANTAAAVDYCRRNPAWRLSLQTHKLIGIP